VTGYGPEDDRRLVRRVVEDGELAAFDALVARHADRVYGLIHRHVADVDQAMNLAQETFFNAYRGLRGFSGECAFFTWLYRIARNVMTSAARYEAARPKIAASLDAPLGDGDGTRGDALPASDGDPVERALREERRGLVAKAVVALPEDFREVVVLRDFEDRSYEEIAELLGVAVGTVKSRLHRARAALASALKPVFAEPRAAR
jgi:RNA polymerase sigma-70 factor, ECF subfamily